MVWRVKGSGIRDEDGASRWAPFSRLLPPPLGYVVTSPNTYDHTIHSS